MVFGQVGRFDAIHWLNCVLRYPYSFGDKTWKSSLRASICNSNMTWSQSRVWQSDSRCNGRQMADKNQLFSNFSCASTPQRRQTVAIVLSSASTLPFLSRIKNQSKTCGQVKKVARSEADSDYVSLRNGSFRVGKTMAHLYATHIAPKRKCSTRRTTTVPVSIYNRKSRTSMRSTRRISKIALFLFCWIKLKVKVK